MLVAVRRSRRIPIAVVVALLAACIPRAFAQEPMTDKRRLQGSWTLVEITHKGETRSAADDGVTCEFVEDLVAFKTSKDTKTIRYRYRLDETAAPKQLDISAYAAQLEEQKLKELGAPKDHFYDMIYSFEGETLKICAPLEWTVEHKRPDRFGGTKDDPYQIWTFKRRKLAKD